ncbi:MAG: transposase [Pedobacter sp.]|uniref:RNA-guided endonuclease InsQ/TnpB family protein n=1 Tax=Pedobacter sp. TaxID=1411316 RepID=UPI0035690D12
MIRTEQIRINGTPELSTLCHLSKNLWNEANYIIRQQFFLTGKWIRYNELDKMMQSSNNYKKLGSASSQQALMLLDKNWVATFKGIKERTKNPSKFKGKVGLPHYKPKDGESIIIFTNRGAHIRNGYLTFTKKLPLSLKTRLPDNTKLKQVRIIPKVTYYICEIVYEKRTSEKSIINRRWYSKNNNILGIDYGVDNIITMSNNIGLQSIVIKGSIIKSENQWYNKRRAELQSIYDRQNNKSGLALSILTINRNARVKDIMHKISHYVINYCLENNIGTIVIGHNKSWKQNINIGKHNNQNFVSIPYYLLTNLFKYKAEEEGIKIIEINEAHTSKCSFLDNEPICHQEKYLGKRIKRGLFQSSNGTLINADVQGSLNIIKKVFPNAFADGIVVQGLVPKRLSILELLS